MHRTYESGAVKRKNKEEKARKDEELRNKIPCITFFMKERTTAEVSDSIESTVALAPVTVDNESIESSDQNVSEMLANDLVITSQPSQVESTETSCVNIVNTFSNDLKIQGLIMASPPLVYMTGKMLFELYHHTKLHTVIKIH